MIWDETTGREAEVDLYTISYLAYATILDIAKAVYIITSIIGDDGCRRAVVCSKQGSPTKNGGMFAFDVSLPTS